MAQGFYFGADLSYVNEMEDCGDEYKVNNAATDPYDIFKDNGVNLVRLRLWHTPSWYDELNNGNRYSDFEDVRQSIIRAKSKGMDVLLDFHLSDNWADPENQVIPAAWAPVVDNLSILHDSLYNYIFSTLNKLAIENLLPELVQIGNETNRGILLSQAVNDSGWTLEWNRNSILFNTAIDAIRDIESAFQTPIKIAIHIANPSQVGWYIDQFSDHGVNDFDIVGISYYWQWHMKTFEEVGNTISSLKNLYPEKEVMIFETAYPWTTSNADGANNLLSIGYPGYTPLSPANQKEWLIDLTQEVIDAGGSGVIYWEPAWVSTGCSTQFAQGSSWDNATFFNGHHELIESGGIAWMSHPYVFTSISEDGHSILNGLDIYYAGNQIFIRRNENLILENEFQIEFYSLDGKIIGKETVEAKWENNTWHLLVPELASGGYLLVVRQKNFIKSKLIFNP
ncbi:MAG TPA: glycosyl hydrolase 53 family protein [Saprospiraceae bacterium]|nr:glycosyl hydrolase 53 family protein [Saprospiraceae bacterium]